MWKHKNFINLQLCAGPIPFPIVVNGTDVYIQRLSDGGETGEETWSYNASINTDIYSISGNTVIWNDGTILQYNSVDVLPTANIISDGQYTTRTATPTLTFKHFFDAGTVGSGTYKFRHYSQQEPSSGETWVLNESVSFDLSVVDIDFVSNNENFKSIIAVTLGKFEKYLTYTRVNGDTVNAFQETTETYWANQAYRTITFATAPTGDLLTWLQANGTKQGGGGQVIKAGTYKFIENPVFPDGIDITEKLLATINTLTDNDVYGGQTTVNTIGVAVGAIGIYSDEFGRGILGPDWHYDTENGDSFHANSDNSKLRTIIITTDQTVSDKLYKWLITDGNLVKLS